MPATRVKVCGLTNEADLETAVDAGADAVGVICDVPVDTPREVSVERARDLVSSVPPFATTVLVTMASDPDRAVELVERVGPDAIQLHGDADRDVLERLRSDTGVDVLLAIDSDEVAAAERYDRLVDGLLVDTVDESGGGGTGETHDWDRTKAAAADLESPLILAGGLTPENVAEAVRTVEPFAVDVASGVEAEGGVKDPEAVRSFVDRAKNATQPTELEPEPEP
ncbi:phosphoribosylanthranilate isomerase [Halopiger xanaduensis]|uniref:N-(5'-phosphoribosyl)anthranilate isomerase n=1 Tax=Halopiger xanaduensis (strain DSM 18323 / JCM 14033 / SH-6) TaxID=797210 RepID=F8D9U2_HALXS|nr:phosphoribosylanthranilate isomerase [Halopiger xanaduensis]AEH35719.1 Phosphoribosylanthranilate isomerase [Halopiger xanaduensis SH-6]